MKRRLREIGRRKALPALGEVSPADLLVRAKRAAYEADFAALEAELMTAVEAWCSGEV